MAQVFDADVRYGSSFLSVDNHRHSVPGEIMTNKVTGEVYIKRPGDGKIISFRQKSHTLYEAIQEFNIQFQSSVGFIHPESPGSYLLGTKFLVDEFEPDENKKDILKEYHEFSKNDYKYKDFIFEVSGDDGETADLLPVEDEALLDEVFEEFCRVLDEEEMAEEAMELEPEEK